MGLKKRVCVTGGAGFIGSALVWRLVLEGHDVTAMDNFTRGSMRRLRAENGEAICRIVEGDVRDLKDVERAMKYADVCVHAAFVQGTQTFYEQPRKVMDVALRGIMNVIQSSWGKELLLISSSEVYQSPGPKFFPTGEDVPLSVPDVTNPRYSYGGGKIACELAALAYADVLERVVIVRPHNVYGPDMGEEHVIPQLARRMLELHAFYEPKCDPLPFPIQGTGEETRCFNYIDDAVDGLMILLDKGEHQNVYHLGAGYEVQIDHLAEMIATYYGRRIIRVTPSEALKGSPPRRKPDISKMRALGYAPQVSLARGLAHALDWYRANPCT